MTPIRARRWAVGGITLAAFLGPLLAAGPAPAATGDACHNGAPACVVVNGARGAHSLTAPQVAADADVKGQKYEVRGSDSSSDDPYTGISIEQLLARTGQSLPPDGHVDIDMGSGSAVQLSAGQISSTTYYVHGLRPIVYVDGDKLGFLRPLIADPAGSNKPQPGDDNLYQERYAEIGQLDVTVYDGGETSVSISPADSTPPKGTPVRLTATVTPSESGVTGYTWYWPDSTKSFTTSPRIKHTFSACNAVPVHVQAVDEAAQTSGYGSTTITPDCSSPTPPPSPGPSSGGGHHRSGGPSPTAGSHPPAPGKSTTRQSHANNHRSRSAGGAAGDPRVSSVVGRLQQFTSHGLPRGGRAPQVAGAPGLTGTPTLISGRLISDEQPLAASAAPASALRSLTELAQDPQVTPTPSSRWTAVLGVAAALLLLLAGAGREWRNRRS